MRIISAIFTTIVTAITQLIAIFAFVVGTLYLWQAAMTLNRYYIGYSTSAVQITQIYSEGMFYALVAIGMFVFATLIQVALNTTTHRLQTSLKNIEKKTTAMNDNLLRLSRFLARQQGEATNRTDTQR